MFVLQLSGLGLVCMCDLRSSVFVPGLSGLGPLSVLKGWAVQVKTDWNMLCSLSLLKRSEKPIETQVSGMMQRACVCRLARETSP